MNNRFQLLYLFVLLLMMFTACSSESDTPIRALYLTGGGWHDYEAQKTLLTEGVSERLGDAIEWTIVHEGDGEPDHHLSVVQEENWTDEYDVIVHNTGFGRVTDGGFLEQLAESHKGTPAVLIHASIHSYRYAEPADPWFDFMGVKSMWHEDQREFEVENIAPDYSIMEGLPDSWQNPPDEIYVIEERRGDINPLAQAFGTQTEAHHPVAWTYETGETRVFATTLGHNNTMFEQDHFLDMIANGILWSVDRQ